MRILHCHIENFGRLSQVDMDFSRGIQWICQENGWGKSTLAAFLCAMFYGLGGDRRQGLAKERRRYAPWQGGIFGGSMTFTVGDRTYTVTRIFRDKEANDEFELRDADTNRISSDYSADLGQELFSITRESFLKTVWIRQNSEFPQAADDIHAKIGNLSNLTNDMNHCEDAVKRLNAVLAELNPKRSTGRLSRRRLEIASLMKTVSDGEGLKDTLRQVQKKLKGEQQHYEELTAARRRMYALSERAADLQYARAGREERERMRLRLEECRQSREEARRRFPKAVPSREEIDEQLHLCYRIGQPLTGENDHDVSVSARPKSFGGWQRFILLCIALLVSAAGIGGLVGGKSLPGGIFLGIGAILCLLVVNIGRIRRDWEADHADAEESESSIHGRSHSRDRIRDFLESYGFDSSEHLQDDLLGLRDMVDDLQDAERDLARVERAYEQLTSAVETAEPGEELPSLQEISETLAEINEAMEVCHGNILAYRQRMETLQQELDDHEENRQILMDLQRIQQEEELLYARVMKARDSLEAAREAMTSRYADPIYRRFCCYYSYLTGNPADACHLDSRVEVTMDEMGRQRPVESLSCGNQDLIGFCLRLALADVMFCGEPPMLVMDDPFVNLDDARLDAAMDLLEEIGYRYQIIYFTCSEGRCGRKDIQGQ